jgi:hypothetical protein
VEGPIDFGWQPHWIKPEHRAPSGAAAPGKSFHQIVIYNSLHYSFDIEFKTSVEGPIDFGWPPHLVKPEHQALLGVTVPGK